jgi:glutamate-1-semialdehyde 2,1-aminomutase
MDPASLKVLKTRTDIACVLVNPLQALHPNANAPSDSTLLASDRSAHFSSEDYRTWLVDLRRICTERGIVLIFDEVFVGFRLARGGAQSYFGVKADLVTYGKTLGGGLPVGVVCGTHRLMKRYRERKPADICFARGTFNSHPLVMAAMNAFLRRLDEPRWSQLYEGLDARWNQVVDRFNARMESEHIPVRAAALQTIWTLYFTRPNRYNWMLQFYLRAEGILLSWVGTGRIIFPLVITDQELDAIFDAFVSASRRMQADGYFWHHPQLTNRSIKKHILRELIRRRPIPFPIESASTSETAQSAPAPGPNPVDTRV